MNSEDGNKKVVGLYIVIVGYLTQISKIGVLQEGLINLNHTGVNSSDKEVKKLQKYVLLFSYQGDPIYSTITHIENAI